MKLRTRLSKALHAKLIGTEKACATKQQICSLGHKKSRITINSGHRALTPDSSDSSDTALVDGGTILLSIYPQITSNKVHKDLILHPQPSISLVMWLISILYLILSPQNMAEGKVGSWRRKGISHSAHFPFSASSHLGSGHTAGTQGLVGDENMGGLLSSTNLYRSSVIF